MTLPDLNSLSYAELQQVIDNAKSLSERRRAQEMEDARAKVRSIISELGFSEEELLGTSVPMQPEKRKRNVRKPEFVYQHPDDASIYWRGRGRQPSWMIELAAEKREALKLPFDSLRHN